MTDKLHFDATMARRLLNQQPNTCMRNITFFQRSFLALVAGILTAIPGIGNTATLTFQQGVNGYSGTVDTYVRNDQATTSFGTATLILVDNLSPVSHGLIRFDNIFGGGANQIPLGSTITSATLTLRTFNNGDRVEFHRMLNTWSGSDTWNSLVNGISADNVEALSAVDGSFLPVTPVPRVDVIDVTPGVQAWSDGAVNFGWAMLPTNNDGVQSDSSENTTNSLRPLLTVNYTLGVTNPIVIVAEPQDQAVLAGGTATFSVVVSGTAPRYQWYRGGSPILNATNGFLQITNVQNSDVGLYHVVVSNALNSVTSRDAVLSITIPPFVLFGLTNYNWKYEQSNTDLGVAWRATNYNDSGWSSGLGILAYENEGINATIATLTNTVLNPAALTYVTRYFRTSFVFTNDPISFGLISSNYVDDGMVVYLNGLEAFRYNMPAGNIVHSTLAVAANPAGEGVFIVSNIPPSLVRMGTNVIAVEVHQNATTSSDVDFGMALFVRQIPPTILAITNQPQSITVNESQTATFSVGVQGAPAYFQWYKDGVAVSNGTFNPFTISITTTNDAGNYFVVVTNAVNSVTSSVATLTIIPDTNAPVLLTADGTESLSSVLVSFSERITLLGAASATNVNNYRITNTTGAVIGITSATLIDGTNVLLATAARTAGQNYILVVNRLQDIGPRMNVIATNSSLPITSRLAIIGLGDGGWRFYDPLPEDPINDAPNLGTTWKEFTYTETNFWGNGTGIFWNGDVDDVPGPVGTHLSQSTAITSYYRKNGVSIPQLSPGGLKFLLTHVIDDGGVMYLNGQEIFRFNLPSGTIDYQTRADSQINPVVRTGPVPLSIPSSLLRVGANVVAFELHTRNPSDIDKFFGMQLDANVQSYVIGPVVITGGPTNITVSEGSSVSFEAIQAGGATFQWQSNGVAIAGATNPILTVPAVTLAMSGTSFRVAVSNSTSFAFSTNGILTVVADTNAPVLLGAVLTTNGTVVASFSEALSASGTVLANYRITNSAGANIPISGAVFANNTNVVLTVGNLPTNNYVLIVSNVQDKAVVPNTISPNPSVARIGFEGPLVILGLAGSWRYEQSGTDLGTAWRGPAYSDATWPSGQALFGVETATLPDTIRTPLTLGPSTYYFRTLTNAPLGGNRATLRIRTVLDDGAVYYLNGVEILRVRIADGVTVVYGTFAANQANEGIIETFDVVVTNLVAGQNLFSVEVHQTSAGSSDVVFGAEISVLRIDSTIIAPPGLQIITQPQSRTNVVGTTATFTVAASGTPPIYYQWRKGGVNIVGQTNTTLSVTNVQLSDNGNAYTVVVTNSSGSLTSVVATLTVTNSSCTILPTWPASFKLGTNELRQTVSHPFPNATTFVLVWTNPATNSCGSNATVVLQRTTALLNPSASTVWTNVFTNVFGTARVTNTVVGTNTVFYRLRVP